MNQSTIVIALVSSGLTALASIPASADDPEAGAKIFRACAACHSLEPGRQLTGPSLANLWNRKAGTVEEFHRYSPALKASNITWNERSLDAWLADPQQLVPGNRMTFRGIKDKKLRGDLIAFLKSAGSGNDHNQMRMGGMMRGPAPQDLKALGPEQQIAAIRYCGDTYFVTTAAGETISFWEFNLRLKTDSARTGPPKGKPALVPAGMMGDRASAIFSDPAEISTLIEKKC